MRVKFTATPEEVKLVGDIAERAQKLMPTLKLDRTSLHMDLLATHANGNPMDFKKLLNAPDFDFLHDVTGIIAHLDRKTGKLLHCFLPRCSKVVARELTHKKTTKKTITTTLYDVNQYIKYEEVREGGKFKSGRLRFKDKALEIKYGVPLLVDKAFWSKLDKNPFTESREEYFWGMYIDNPTKENVESDKYDIVYADFDNFELFTEDFSIVPLPRIIDYMNGYYLTDRDMEIEKYLEYAETREDIIEARIEDIPYYNRTNERTKTLVLRILPSKEKYKELVRMVENSITHWAMELRDILSGNSYNTYDYLGIGPFIKPGKGDQCK